jgi:hypothetical protein
MPPWKRISYFIGNTLATVVVLLLLVDPTRPAAPVFILSVAALGCWLLPALLGRSGPRP